MVESRSFDGGRITSGGIDIVLQGLLDLRGGTVRLPFETLLLAALLLAGPLFPSAASGAGNANAKLVLHLTAPSEKTRCLDLEEGEYFPIETKGDLYPPATYFAYVLVVDGSPLDGIGGIEFGIDYDGMEESGVEIYDWTFCGALQYPSNDWPAAGSGNLCTWDWLVNRRLGGRAVAGYFYLGAVSQDRLAIVPRTGNRVVYISDTQGIVDSLSTDPGKSLGALDFGGGTGVDPKQPTPFYESPTWFVIRRLYHDPAENRK